MTTLLQKRRKELRTELIQIEKQIYDLETAYLEETKDTGNIFTGWDMSGHIEKKSKKSTQNEDRHFSLSSITSPASRREESKKSGGQAGKKTKEVKVEDKEDEETDAN